MKRWLNTYFGFSSKEVNGLLTLVALIGVTMFVPYLYGLVKKKEPITEAERNAVLKLALAANKKLKLENKVKLAGPRDDTRSARLFTFDPNTIGQAEWERLGLSSRQASAILKYIAKGGRFKKPEDLQKMYTISAPTYKRLVPYVNIADTEASEDRYQPKSYIRESYDNAKVTVVEINGADTIELDKIKGIGRTFANRIVKYRTRIGGFYKKEQLLEVFGIDSVKYNEIKDQVVVDKSKLKKINVNTAGFEDFRNHPYIRYKQVNALIAYRKQHGNYSNIADLNKVVVLNEETINRLAAYLEF